MSEDRTQPASPRRRQLAREQGRVAHSPELTAAVGWLVAVAMLACCHASLVGAFVDLARAPLVGATAGPADAADLARLVRGAALGAAVPVGVLLGGFAAGAFLAHQAQTRGLWAPSLIAPDVSRLWRFGRGGGAGAQLERCVWSVAKAVVLAAVAYHAIRSRWGALQELSFQDFPRVAADAIGVLLAPAWWLGGAMLVVGAVDYGLRFARFEAMLRATPEEQREDLRTIDGDPKARAARRRLAQAMRDGGGELLEGATLAVLGDAGLIVVLAGGPPPRKVFVRVMGRGKTSASLRRAVIRAGLPLCEDRGLALQLAARPAISARGAVVDPLLIAQLRGAWPAA